MNLFNGRNRLLRSAQDNDRLKQHLAIHQQGQVLHLLFRFSRDVRLNAVWFLVNEEQWTRAATINRSEEAAWFGDAMVDLGVLSSLEARSESDQQQGERNSVRAFVEVTGPNNRIPAGARERSAERDETGATHQVSGRIPLGRFGTSEIDVLKEVAVGEHRFHPYINRRGNLAVAVNRPVPAYARVHIDELSLRNGSLRLDGRIYSRHTQVQRADLVLLGRLSGTRLRVPVALTLDSEGTRRRFGLRRYRFTSRANLDNLFNLDSVADDTFDVWLESSVEGATPNHVGAPVVATNGTVGGASRHLSRVGRSRYLVRRKVRTTDAHIGSRRLLIVPYFTVKAKYLSFTVEVFTSEAFDVLRHAGCGGVLRKSPARRRTDRPVWIVGEMPFKAQDTGLAFFRHVAVHHPEIDVRYVIDTQSPEMKNLVGFEDRIVEFRSAEHVRLALRAERIIGSHHPDYLYPTRWKEFTRRITAVRVFLQHGVMGMKWMTPMYGKSVPGFDTDLFIVSSEREKRMIVEDFGYRWDEVAVTGLSRFDTLFDDSISRKPRQVLVLPTWRDWLTSAEAVRESEFTSMWKKLLGSDRLASLKERYDLDIVFGLHPNMRQYIGEFEELPVRTFVQGEADVQDLLKSSSVMITDYSSAGLDFSFLHRTLIYYQFDRERFFRGAGSHFDLDSELPGPVHFTPDRVLDELERHFESGGRAQQKYIERADALIAYRDRGSSERIFQAALAAERKWELSDLLRHEAIQAGWGLMRRSKYYFPVMRRAFAAWKALPADDDLIVFESGMGRQFADSPRAIYHELHRRGDTRKKVWVLDGRLPVDDPYSKVVKRLSPEYFWYLARARYWVNNQNFPHYVTRRPHGVYLQTWHGTPLKRMLHDIDEITGRDEGYLERVSTATSQWTHLISPSPYATRAFASAFRHEAEVLEVGYPRNDLLFGPERDALAGTVRERLGIAADRKVVLYAPTFRDDANIRGNSFGFDLQLNLKRFAQQFGDDCTLLLRMHLVVRRSLDIPEEAAEAVLDVSAYPDIQELFLISDVLVTDYSSVFFDYSILRRPMVFYAYDLDRYRDELRGFYLDYEREVPGPIARTEDELFAALHRTIRGDAQAQAEARELADAFAERFAPYDDGHAAVRAVDAVFGKRTQGGGRPEVDRPEVGRTAESRTAT